MPTLKLCQALCVVALAAGPVSAAENPPITNPSNPVIKKDGTKTPDAPETPTLVDPDGFKPQPSAPGANPKIGPSGGSGPKSAGGASGNKSTVIKNKEQTAGGSKSNTRN